MFKESDRMPDLKLPLSRALVARPQSARALQGTVPVPATALSVQELLESGLDAYRQSAFERALELLLQAEQAAVAEASPSGATTELAQILIAQGKVHRDLGEPTLALERMDRALELAQQSDDPVTEGDALNQRAGIHHSVGEYALALADLEQALQIARRSTDERRVANCLINVGLVGSKLADFPSALAALKEAHGLLQGSLQDRTAEAQCLTNLGLLYQEMGDDARALEVAQQALDILAGLDNLSLEAITTVNLAQVQRRLGQRPTALCSFERALSLARQIGLTKVEISALDGLGQTRAELGECAQALRLHGEALLLARASGDSDFEIDALLNLGRDHLEAREGAQAISPLGEALDLTVQTHRPKSRSEAHRLLAAAHEQLGHTGEALGHFRAFHQLEQTLFTEERERKTRQLSIQFDLERARHAAEVYRIRTDIEQGARERAEATVQQRTRELERGHRTIELQRQELQEKVLSLHHSLQQNEVLRGRLMLAATRSTALNERFLRRLSAELHDGPAQDLGFALLKLGGDTLPRAAEELPEPLQTGYLQELGGVERSLARALGEMRAIARGMCLPELGGLSLEETVHKVISTHQRRTRTEVQVQIDNPEQVLPLPVKITLYRLVQESLANAFKHGGGVGQMVRLWAENDDLLLAVSDEGPGFDLSAVLAQSEGLGLLGMRERVESLGGNFRLNTAPGQGTHIEIRLPVRPPDTAQG
jgi:signal transduction histidine kinase/Tfp pilus assembly protein PilF